MSWIVFSYSLPVKQASSARVSLWRRLQRLGAVAPKAGVYVLPAQDDCVEAFQWLAQEVQRASGEAVVMRVERFEGLTDRQLMDQFREACRMKYAEIEIQASKVEKRLSTLMKPQDRAEIGEKLQRLQKRQAEVMRVDFFESPQGASVTARLRRIQEILLKGTTATPAVPHVSLSEYRDKRWVTRPRPHVDRLACAWLIRRFINPTAAIRYATDTKPGEVAFDMRDSEFGHRGNLCTFETMIAAFRLKEPALPVIAEIVHEIDLRDGRYARPEVAGLDVILRGWLLEGLSDQELESHGVALFQAMYAAISRKSRQLTANRLGVMKKEGKPDAQ